MRAVRLAGAVAAVMLAAAGAVAAPAGPAIGGWGVDRAGGDPAVKPGDDFYRYAAGKWFDAAVIPADRPAVGSFYDLGENVQASLKELVTAAAPDSQIGTLYASFMDEAGVEKVGLAPLMADIARVRAVSDKAGFARLMGEDNRRFGAGIIDIGVSPDTANPDLNVLWNGQSGLGLPDRDYYLNPAYKPQRDAYAAYVERTMAAIGEKEPAKAAATVLDFETAIAKVSWEVARRRDISQLNNPYSTAGLAAYAPGLDWGAYFAGAGVPDQKRMIVQENSAIRAIVALYAATPLETLKLWEQFHTADQAAPYLTKAMVDSRFEFVRTLSGVSQQRPRWKRGVALVNGSLGELLGQAYVARFFPPEAKAKMVALVANLKSAMAGRIAAAPWMSAGTRAAALEKLAKMDVFVGYPDKWRDYSGLKIVAGDLYGNVERANGFNADYGMADLGKPVDRAKWAMTPQTVNAYNGFNENKIVFPAAILQAPFFDPEADDAVNYGAIGAVIGHEISHGFDDQGRKVDASGALRDWWAPEDAKRFEAEAKKLGDEFAKFSVAPGLNVNPQLTMGENIADLAGVTVALDAYTRSLGGRPAPVIDGLSGDQRFFLGFAQVWRAKQRDDLMKNQVASDPHSPARFRVIGPLPNVDGWYRAFDVKPGDAMYIAPGKRARIW